MSAPRLSRNALIEFGIAGAVLAWRLFSVPVGELWRDWILILSLYWIYAALSPSSNPKLSTAVTLGTMTYLLGVHVTGQMGQTLSVLGLGP